MKNAQEPPRMGRRAMTTALIASVALATCSLSSLPAASTARAETVAEDGDRAKAWQDGTEATADGSSLATDLSTDAEHVTLTRTALTPGLGYDSETYLERYKIEVAQASIDVGERSGYPLSNAFDGNWNNNFMAPGIKEEAVYTIDFGKVEQLSKILFKHFTSGQPTGFPTHFKIFASTTGDANSYEEVADYQIANSERATGPVTFSLSRPVSAKSIKIQVITSPGGVVASEMKFLRFDQVASDVEDLFADADKTVVADKYQNRDELAKLRAEVEQHPSSEEFLGYIERAEMILDGTWKLDASFTRGTVSEAGKGFDSEAFLNVYGIKVKNYSTDNAGKPNSGIEKAFDGDWSTRYEANGANTATVTMELEQESDVHRIIYSNGYTNAYGYPEKMTVAFSDTGREGSWREVPCNFSATNDKVIFTLSQAVKAKYVRITMSGIYGGINFRPCAAEIKLVKFDQVEYDVSSLFKDARTQYTLSDQWNTVEALTDLQNRVNAHPSKDEFAKDMARAWAVFRGEVKDQNDRLDWPVHVIQKTGPDSERAVWVFLAEGYRADEMDKFIKDITERAQAMLELEPFRSMAPYINMYAYCAASNESGYSKPSEKRDTFFQSYYDSKNGNVNGGSNQTRCNLARDWITQNYLDEGGKIMHATAIVNTNDYFGQGNGTSTASLSAGYKMTVHEGAHMFATLVDHYTANNVYRGDVGGTNQTANRDPKTIRWREFLGHRKVTIQNAGDIAANPTGDCLMNHYGTNIFCEVCRESIFRKINDVLPEGKKNPMYVAQPELTIKRTEQEIKDGDGTGDDAVDKAKSAKEWDAGPVINESNITKANGRQLKYRTVVSNFLSENQDVTLSLRIVGADGQEKHAWTKTESIHPNTTLSFDVSPKDYTGNNVKIEDIRQAGAVSVELVTEELSDLAEGDKIEARVTYNGELMGTDATISYGTARISYKLKDASGNVVGDMPEMGTVDQRVLTGTNNLSAPPEVYGYTYVNSNIDESEWRAKEGVTDEIIRYYRETSVQVTKRLVDWNGLLISESSARVATGTTITPSKADFTVAVGYKVDAPAAVEVGKEDITLTYTVRKGSDVANAARGATAKAYNPDGSAAFERPNRPLSIAVDGNKTDVNSYGDYNNSNGRAPSYAEFDLGGTYDLMGEGEDTTKDVIRLWRYWGDGRTYRNTVIVASEKGTFAEGDYTVLYNADADNMFGFGNGADSTYKETKDGLHVDAPAGTRASKVRVYMNGSEINASNHIVELEVMGKKLDLTYNTELEELIESLSRKVESGLYTKGSSAAATNAVERARRRLIAGAGTDVIVNIREELVAADKKLRRKDESLGSIQYLGGSLRMDADVENKTALRMGFWFRLPEGAELVRDKSGWTYGLGSLSGKFRSIDKLVEVEEGGFVANAVLTNIPSDHYGTPFVVRARLVYKLDGEERIVESDVVNSRSVDGVATKIESSSSASDRERELAARILAS